MNTADTRTDASKKAGLPDAVARAIEAARDKKALDLVALDLRHLSSFTDFFVICSGQNVRQVVQIGANKVGLDFQLLTQGLGQRNRLI